MSALAFADGMAALLGTDAALQAALVTLLGYAVPRVLRSNQPWEQIPSDLYPCWIVEHGPGATGSITNTGDDVDGLVIGHHRQGFNSELDIALLWSQCDRERAATQRGTLPELLAQLLMRNPQPGGTGIAFLQNWVPDQGVNHPRHVFAATVRAEYAIYRS